VSVFFRKIVPIPFASTIFGVGSKVASALGYSVPTVTKMPEVVRNYGVVVSKVDDAVPRVVMATRSDKCLTRSFDDVCGSKEDLDLIYYMQHPCNLGNYQITSTHETGHVIWTSLLAPARMVFKGSADDIWNTRISYTAKCFDFWRGSFRFCFSFCASSFHSCRVRIIYEPSGESLDKTWTADNLNNVIFDVSGDSEVCVSIPYFNIAEWKSVDSARDEHIGRISVVLMNELTSGTSPVNPIWMQVFVSAGADFQFAGPSLWGIRDSINIGDTDWETNGLEKDNIILQSFDSEVLRRAEYKSISQVDVGYRDDGTYMSDGVDNIKQLLNITCQWHLVTVKYDQDPKDWLRISTGGVLASHGGPFPEAYTSYIHHWLRVFRFFRGGLRIQVVCSDPGHTLVKMYGSIISGDTDIIDFESGKDFVFDKSVNRIKHTFGQSGVIEVEVPGRCGLRCNRTLRNSGGAIASEFHNNVLINCRSDANHTGQDDEYALIYVGGADDFIIGEPMPIPKQPHVFDVETVDNDVARMLGDRQPDELVSSVTYQTTDAASSFNKLVQSVFKNKSQ